MKDVRDGGNVDESRFPGHAQRRRPRRWLRALAAICLAFTMAGGSTLVAGGIASGTSAHVLAPNEPRSVLSATTPEQEYYCLEADTSLSQVWLTWSPSASANRVTVYQRDPLGNVQPAEVSDVTDNSAQVL